MSSNPLGKSTSYVSNYDSSLLFPIARNEGIKIRLMLLALWV